MTKTTFIAAAALLSLAGSAAALLPMQAVGAAGTTAVLHATVGQPAPDFTLTDTYGKDHTLSQYKGKFVVLEWINCDCPFVRKHYDSGNMQMLQDKYTKKGVVWLSINTAGKGKPGYYPAEEVNAKLKQWNGHQTAYLLDTSTKVGRMYGAKATPTMVVIDRAGTIVYDGAIDSKNTADKEDIKTATNYVEAALDAQLAGKPVATASTKAYGCFVHYQ